MTANSNPLARIQELESQIISLRVDALKELKAKRIALSAELDALDAQIGALSGSSDSGSGKRARAPKEPAKSVPLQDLKALLEKAPDKTLSIRKENMDLRNIKILAEANPHLLKMGGNGPWPTVTLLK